MVVGPKQEAGLFTNRDKFDLIAIYDTSSSSYGSDTSPISILLRLIWEQAFKKMLRRMPMLLVGGIEAWKKEFGEREIVRSPSCAPGVEIRKPVPLSVPMDYSASVGSAPHSRNPFANGSISASGPSSAPIGHDFTTKIGVSIEQSGHARQVSNHSTWQLCHMMIILLDHPRMLSTLVHMLPCPMDSWLVDLPSFGLAPAPSQSAEA